jgi:nicotinate-nucleotide adenylyltransferase
MKIGILGGSFNPPHVGHLLIAMQVKTILQLDEVWLMPCFRLQKGFEKEFASVQHRIAMAKYLENEYIKVSDYEITQNQQSYSIDTLEGLKKLYPENTFYWITGTDQMESFQRYYRWHNLVHQQNLIIFPREYILPYLEEKVKESLALQEIPENITVLHSADLILTNISSTRIRQRIKSELPIHFLVPETVEDYISKHQLYNK